MPNVSLIFILRDIASASLMLQVLRAVSANHCIGIWPKKTPVDAQVRCLLNCQVLPCHRLFISVFSVPALTRERFLSQFDLFNMLHNTLVYSTSILPNLTKIYVYCFHVVNACELFVFVNHSFWLNFMHISNGIQYCTFVLYNY